MRIPWYISTALCILVTLLTLYLCTKNHDITAPPTPEETVKALSKWRADNPAIRDTKLSVSTLKPESEKSSKQAAGQNVTEQHQETPEPEIQPLIPRAQPILDIPLVSPSLDFLTDQSLSTYELNFYAEENLNKGNFQLARLAYERIIDFAKDSTAEEQKKAASAILSLKPKTPLWNPDPTTRIKLSLTLNTTNISSAESTKLINNLKQLIIDSSDGTLIPFIKLTKSTTPLSSLKLAGARPITFTITDDSDLKAKITRALYNIVRNKNIQEQRHTTTPLLPTNIPPQQALESYITRLSWLYAAQ